MVSEGRERSHWVQNVRAQPTVAFLVGRRLRRAIARPLDPAAEPELHARVSALMDERHDWSDGLIVEIVPEGQWSAP